MLLYLTERDIMILWCKRHWVDWKISGLSGNRTCDRCVSIPKVAGLSAAVARQIFQPAQCGFTHLAGWKNHIIELWRIIYEYTFWTSVFGPFDDINISFKFSVWYFGDAWHKLYDYCNFLITFTISVYAHVGCKIFNSSSMFIRRYNCKQNHIIVMQ